MHSSSLQFLGDEAGATSIEYGLVVTFVSIALLTILAQTGGSLQDLYGELASLIRQPADS